MTDSTDHTRDDDEAEGAKTPELDGQSTTVEEAMDAATDEEGFADESAYTTPAGSTAIEEGTVDVDDVTGSNDVA